MRISIFALVIILSSLSHGTNGHAQDFSTDIFLGNINRDGSDSVTRAEVDAFFQASALSRCAFLKKMIPTYSSDSTLVSVLYDSFQTNDDGRTLQADEFRQTLLGQEDTLSMDEVKENMRVVMREVHDMTIRPYQFIDRPGRYVYDAFKADAWASDIDTNEDGVVALDEISAWMRGTLDADGNFFLERCEFVEAMRRYTQHPATSAKIYDVIFKSRDLMWADVDSHFLAILISTKDRETITTEEFSKFFDYQNGLASGAVVMDGGSASPSSGNSGTSLVTSARSGQWLLVFVLIFVSVFRNF